MAAITRVLCAIDFSDCSRRALDHAIAIGRWFGADIDVLHVTPEPLVSGRAEMQMRLQALRTEAHAEAIQQTKRFIESARASDLNVHVSVERGDPAAVIVAAAPSAEAGLVVMGTHGRSGFERLLLGSVTERVLRRVRCPLLTVPPHVAEAPAQAMFTRVLCPVDFSETSALALEYASSLVERTGGSLIVLHAIEEFADEPREYRRLSDPEYRRQLEEEARSLLRTALTSTVRRTRPPEELVVAGRAHSEILRVAAERGADAIVIGIRGRHVVDRLLLGSTTDRVVRAASCPVLTIRQG